MSEQTAFTCQRCGHCCHGEGGIVLDEGDLVRLAAHLCLPEAEFCALYTETKGGKLRLRTGATGDCVFYSQGCAVHPARPDICRAWPFFKGNLIDAISLDLARDYCPGINPEIGHADFARQGMAYLRRRGLIKTGDKQAAGALTLPEDQQQAKDRQP